MSIRLSGLIVAGVSIMAAGLQSALAADAGSTADPLIRGFKDGKAIVDVRVRYEEVDDDNFDDNAKGMTVRTRLGYQTASMGGFRLLGEFTDTRTLFGLDNFNSLNPANPDFPVIADPSNTNVNRAFISYENLDGLLWLAGGRQRIKLDNDRWIGNVGWRQKEQTFDAGSMDLNFGSEWTFSYDYVAHVQTITATSESVNDQFFNLSFGGWEAGKLVAYTYILDSDDTNVKSDSYGLRFNGSVKPGTLSFLYTAEYARQQARLANREEFDADYYTLMVGLGVKAMTFKLGYEVLGSDDGEYGLQTQLATKHAFNGWADQFLNTPDNGLQDTYFDVGAKWLGIKWGAIYHEFSADKGSDRYGSEIDLLAAKKFNPHYTVGIKYAAFSADSDVEDQGFRDVNKFWIWFDFKY
jgi:hypothetical protein